MHTPRKKQGGPPSLQLFLSTGIPLFCDIPGKWANLFTFFNKTQNLGSEMEKNEERQENEEEEEETILSDLFEDVEALTPPPKRPERSIRAAAEKPILDEIKDFVATTSEELTARLWEAAQETLKYCMERQISPLEVDLAAKIRLALEFYDKYKDKIVKLEEENAAMREFISMALPILEQEIVKAKLIDLLREIQQFKALLQIRLAEINKIVKILEVFSRGGENIEVSEERRGRAS